MRALPVVTLKTLIVALLGLLLVCQTVVVPQVAIRSARRYAEIAYLEIPGIVVGILFLICVQVVLIAVWRLLSLVRHDSIFSTRAFADVNVCLAAVAFATVLVVVTLVVLSATGHSTPSITLLCLVGVVVGLGLSLLIVVLRSLLHKAVQLENDLAEVV